MAAGQAELPQAAGQVPLQPTPVSTQSTAQATSPTPGVPAAAAAAAAVPTQVCLTLESYDSILRSTYSAPVDMLIIFLSFHST